MCSEIECYVKQIISDIGSESETDDVVGHEEEEDAALFRSNSKPIQLQQLQHSLVHTGIIASAIIVAAFILRR